MRRHWQQRADDPKGSGAKHTSRYFEGSPYFIEEMEDDDGYFYMGAWNPERVLSPSSGGCTELPFWVEDGEDPDDDLALTPELMAETAYDRMPLPETEVSLSPEDVQMVNLDTWIWADAGNLEEVSVTASLTSMEWEVTVTATPSEMRIDAGTADSARHPEGGVCAISPDGGVGEAWDNQGEEESPPCGVTYLRAGTYTLRAAVTWEVYWQGTGTAEPQPMSSAELETSREVTVEELQTIVRP